MLVNNDTKRNTQHGRQRSQPSPDAETCRLGAIEPLFGVGRPLLYRWEKLGLIKFIRICPPGTKRGVTLVRLDDVRALINRNAGGEEVAA